MSILVNIPTIMRVLTANKKTVESRGGNITEVVDSVEEDYPGIKSRIMKDGEVQKYVNIYLNDDDIRFTGGLSTEVAAGDVLTILPAVAGG
jgi:molybdopterin synthase sulfur carrier subunit